MIAVVVISPATTTNPVVTSVSQATRPLGSWRITSSSTASEIWSAILSGWPSVTDSDVNRKFLFDSFKTSLLCTGKLFGVARNTHPEGLLWWGRLGLSKAITAQGGNQRTDFARVRGSSERLNRALNGRIVEAHG